MTRAQAPFPRRQTPKALNAQAFSLLNTRPREGLRLASRARRLARRRGEADLEVASVRTVVACLARLARFESALRHGRALPEDRLRQAEPATRAAYWNALGVIHCRLGQHALALECYASVLNAEGTETPPGHRAAVRSNIAALLAGLNEFERALAYYREAGSFAASAPPAAADRAHAVVAANGVASVLCKLGRCREALQTLQPLLEADDPDTPNAMRATTLGNAAICHRQLGQLDEAHATLLRLRPLVEGGRDTVALARTYLEFGLVLERRMEPDSAESFLLRALALSEASAEPHCRRDCHEALAAFYERRGALERALDHQQRARALEREMFTGPSARTSRSIDLEVRAHRLQSAFDLERRRTLQLEDEVRHLGRAQPEVPVVGELTLHGSADSPGSVQGSSAGVGLTKRETTVLALLAAGRTNKSMAAELGISPFTVRHYVSVLLKKLNATSRTEAAIVAVQRGWLR